MGRKVCAKKEVDNWVQKFSGMSGKHVCLLSDMVKIFRFIKYYCRKSR